MAERCSGRASLEIETDQVIMAHFFRPHESIPCCDSLPDSLCLGLGGQRLFGRQISQSPVMCNAFLQPLAIKKPKISTLFVGASACSIIIIFNLNQ